ncbi:MAG: hypothetical protein ABIQ81_05250 [Novosphingobium sp.]
MKFAPLFAVLALVSLPASAQVTHQASAVHNGRTIAVTYAPEVRTNLRQTGAGPRVNATCLWRSSIAVQRTALDADGQRIAALTRVVDEKHAGSGLRTGYCTSLSDADKAALAGSETALRSHVAAIADNDADTLRIELASLSSLGHGPAHAR